MYLDLLSENWDEIVKRVIEPLWNRKFKDGYTSSKLDKTDFISLAGEELTKAFKLHYDPEKSNMFTYATNVITRKAKSELRNMRRNKRFADLCAESIYRPVDDESGMTIAEMIPDKPSIEISERAQQYLNSLSKTQRRVAEMIMLGFDSFSIKKELHLSDRRFNTVFQRMKAREKTVIFDEGNEAV